MRFSSAVILITLYNCLTVIASNHQDKNCKTMAFRDIHNKKILKNHTTYNITGIDEEDCSVKCYLNDFCQSTNYNHTSKTCHINTSTRHQHPDDLVDDPETSYRGTENDCIPGSCSADRMCKADFKVGGFSCVCPVGSSKCVPTNCAEVLSGGGTTSGVYMVDPAGQGAFQVFCDQKTLGGGWTVFQRRQDGSVDFWRDWAEYKNGFGDLQGEHWLALDRIHRLTNAVANELRVDMVAEAGETAHAQYGHFTVAAESDKYRLSVSGYNDCKAFWKILGKNHEGRASQHTSPQSQTNQFEVIQTQNSNRRQDGSVDFWRNWAEYKNGIGDLQGEHWLGLDRIHRLTNAVTNELRVDMEADAGETAHTQYGHFSVAAESDKYRLSVGSYNGN
ncbi:uncharacterized protein LOC5517493 [Nematostella vectensis]|uniref:uncharacterized protein LOC5517493 n=1 Tax=Nematostella vectensis TaxID=45351 RepID=UPI00207710E8|nr:uncharacterized protein LOC5517493 [Nematostella vectensis]